MSDTGRSTERGGARGGGLACRVRETIAADGGRTGLNYTAAVD